MFAKVFDLHASPSLMGLFVRGNSYDSVYRFERHMVLPKILAQNCPDYRVVCLVGYLGWV